MYKNFKSMQEEVKGQPAVTVAVAAAQDDHVLAAIKRAMDDHLVKPILVGDESLIRPLMKEVGISDNVEVINVVDPVEAAQKAVALVNEGKAQVLMKGLVNTAIFLKAVLKSPLRTDKMLSHLAAFEVPHQKKVFFMADVALNTYPTVAEKAGILSNSLEALHKLGIKKPKVGILGPNETPSEKIPCTIDAVEIVEMGKKGQFPDAIIEGPMALDVIASAEAAHHKGIDSQVAGDVDLILMPDIGAGNGIAKAMSHYAGGIMSGVLLGAGAPVVVNSRSDSTEGKFGSLLLALLLQRK